MCQVKLTINVKIGINDCVARFVFSHSASAESAKMSMRRPRIKAAAILPPKRPARESSAAGTAPKQPKIELKSEPELKAEPKQLEEKVQANVLESTDKPDCTTDNKPVDLNATTTKPAEQEAVPVAPQEHIDLNDNDIFKSPPMVANHKRTESFSTSDIESDKIDDFYQKGSQGPPSPVKVRQRIRPTPFFGMRRNSLQGYGSDMEDEPRRQRHTSTSSSTGPPTPQRIRPPNIQRIRTESSCSNMSDFGRDQNPRTPRKQEESPRTYTPRKDILVRFRCKVIEKTSLKMSDLIYYNPSTNPMVAADPPPNVSTEETPKVDVDVKPVPEKPIEPQEKETAMPVPQLKLGPDGEMILDEQSLVIETTAEKEARETLANTKVIYMDEFSGNSGFYRRNKRTKDWPPEETVKFYRCLHTVGTDFSLMLSLFPNRSRRDLKLKFKKEERTNLALVNKALLFPNTFNVAELKEELEKDQQILEAKRKELQEIYRKKAEITTTRKKRTKPYQCYTSRSGNVLRGGDLIYDNEVVSPPSKELNEAKPIKKERKKNKKSKKVPEEEDNAEENDMEVNVKDKENKKSNKKQKEEKKKVKEEKKKDKKENKGKKKGGKSKDAEPQENQDPEMLAKCKNEIIDHETDTIPIIFENTFNGINENGYVPQKSENTPGLNEETVLFEFTAEPLTTTKLENYKIINCGAIIPSENTENTSLSDSDALFNPKLENSDYLDVSHTVEIDPVEDDSLSQHTQDDTLVIDTGSPEAEILKPQHMAPQYVSQVPDLCEPPNAVDLILSNALLYKDTKQSIVESLTKTEVILENDPNGSEYGAESPSYEDGAYDNEINSGNIEQNDNTQFIKQEMQTHVQKTENNIIEETPNGTSETPNGTSEMTAMYKTDNREDDQLAGPNDEKYTEDGNQYSIVKEDANELSVEIENTNEKSIIKVDQPSLDEKGSDQSKEESENSSNETPPPEDEKNEESSKDIDDEMERFMHNDLGTILTNLINGSLVVVSSEDENIPDKIVNEIYVMDKETGSLSDRPLDLPEDIVNCIVEELNAS